MTLVLVLLQLSDFIEGLTQVINRSAFLCMVFIVSVPEFKFPVYFPFLVYHEQSNALSYAVAK